MWPKWKETVAVVVGPRLFFAAELYGMNRKITDKMQGRAHEQSPQPEHVLVQEG
jgi:hypothetical protein